MRYSVEPDRPSMGNPSRDSKGSMRARFKEKMDRKEEDYPFWGSQIHMVPGSIIGPMR